MQFFIVPPRKTPGLNVGTNSVLSLNGVSGDVIIAGGTGITVSSPSGQIVSISVTTDTYVLRAGDTITGNLNFSPSTTSQYGLRVAALSSDPLSGQTGAIYYNTSSNTFRGFNASGWEDLGDSGSLTETTANTLYLRLDGSNNPMQGNLQMGTSILRFGYLSTDPGSGTQGDTYWNTTSKVLRTYNGTSWVNVGSGITNITAGTGLAANGTPGGSITSSGTLTVDQGFSPTWTGTHAFTQPITFAGSQTFPLADLYDSSEATGSIIRYHSGAWSVYAPTSDGDVLTLAGGEPVWATTGAGTIGTPSDSTYTDGFFSTWTPSTTVANAFADVNELLLAIAPAKPGVLNGTTLVETAIPTLYSAILSSGLSSTDWYQGGYTAGSVISTYHVGSSFVLSTSSPSSSFYIGPYNNSSVYGNVSHMLTHDGSTVANATYDLTTNTTGTTGSISATALVTYNSIWKLANAQISYTHGSGEDGCYAHQIQHTSSSDITAAKTYFRDSYSISNPTPSFSISPSVTQITLVAKWLSGVEYYGLNSVVRIDFEAAAGIFNRCYCTTRCANISGVGAPSTNVQPSSTPTYNAAWNNVGSTNGQQITLSVSGMATSQDSSGNWTNKYLQVAIYKPSGANATANAALALPVCTYGAVSTTTYESMYDESQRLIHTSFPSGTSFDPTNTPLTNGYAQMRNGLMRYPISTDYSGSPSYSGAQEFQRWFSKTSASTGSLTFGSGFNTSWVSAYGSGDVNMLLYLESDAVWFDLGVLVGTALNGSSQTRDGSSRSRAYGAQSSSATTVIYWSIGLYTTGVSGSGNNARYRFILDLNTSTRTIPSITSA